MSIFFLIFLAMVSIGIGLSLWWLWSYLTQDENTPDGWATLCQVDDASQLVFFKSLLESSGIPYATVGERAQDLFGFGRLGTGFNMITGPVRLQVPAAQVKEARALLQEALSENDSTKT